MRKVIDGIAAYDRETQRRITEAGRPSMAITHGRRRAPVCEAIIDK